METALPVVFTALMALAMLLYVVMDGYDLGVGILLRGVEDADKDRMIASIGPFWDANETWLVLGVGLLLVAFPLAHGVILGALYLPVAAMLVGLILRGVAFDFRVKARAAHKPRWNLAFWGGSLMNYGAWHGMSLIGILFAANDPVAIAPVLKKALAAAVIAKRAGVKTGDVFVKESQPHFTRLVRDNFSRRSRADRKAALDAAEARYLQAEANARNAAKLREVAEDALPPKREEEAIAAAILQKTFPHIQLLVYSGAWLKAGPPGEENDPLRKLPFP